MSSKTKEYFRLQRLATIFVTHKLKKKKKSTAKRRAFFPLNCFKKGSRINTNESLYCLKSFILYNLKNKKTIEEKISRAN